MKRRREEGRVLVLGFQLLSTHLPFQVVHEKSLSFLLPRRCICHRHGPLRHRHPPRSLLNPNFPLQTTSYSNPLKTPESTIGIVERSTPCLPSPTESWRGDDRVDLRNISEVADLNVDGNIKQGSDGGVRCVVHDGSGRVRCLGGNVDSTVAMESLGLASSPAAAAAMEALGLAHLRRPWKRWV
ncbi:uncharacterized protein G2W53_004787 [Senna tora]|uniref:Uncharacterized protein n=1 Tax=Senna tora TaxID=362788 RepID=A0A835CHI8_9FABA|nr:uncharacterized protein G2W53_004787 [Senna tora]